MSGRRKFTSAGEALRYWWMMHQSPIYTGTAWFTMMGVAFAMALYGLGII